VHPSAGQRLERAYVGVPRPCEDEFPIRLYGQPPLLIVLFRTLYLEYHATAGGDFDGARANLGVKDERAPLAESGLPLVLCVRGSAQESAIHVFGRRLVEASVDPLDLGKPALASSPSAVPLHFEQLIVG